MRACHVKFAAILIFNDILILTNLRKIRNLCYFAWRLAEIKPHLPGLDVNKVMSTHTICNHFPYNKAEGWGRTVKARINNQFNTLIGKHIFAILYAVQRSMHTAFRETTKCYKNNQPFANIYLEVWTLWCEQTFKLSLNENWLGHGFRSKSDKYSMIFEKQTAQKTLLAFRFPEWK